jgi:rhodanese-related sulfurtransferase
MTAREARQALEDGAVRVDVREPDEWSAGHAAEHPAGSDRGADASQSTVNLIPNKLSREPITSTEGDDPCAEL